MFYLVPITFLLAKDDRKYVPKMLHKFSGSDLQYRQPFKSTLSQVRALRRLHCVGGGALVNFGRRRRVAGPKYLRPSAAWAVKFSNIAYLFQNIFSKELLLSRYAC